MNLADDPVVDKMAESDRVTGQSGRWWGGGSQKPAGSAGALAPSASCRDALAQLDGLETAAASLEKRSVGGHVRRTPYVLAFLALAFARGTSLSFAAVGLGELSFRRYPNMRDLPTLLVIAVVENVGYRQLSIWWRLRGMISKFRVASAWGVERKGFPTDSDDP